MFYSSRDECINTISLSQSPSETDNTPSDDNPKLPLDKRIVAAFLCLKIDRRIIEQLPIAVQYLFAESLEQSRFDPPIERSTSDVCKLLLRPELLAHANFERDEAIKVGKLLNSLVLLLRRRLELVKKFDVVYTDLGKTFDCIILIKYCLWAYTRHYMHRFSLILVIVNNPWPQILFVQCHIWRATG